MSQHLNAAAPVTAVVSADQASLRFGDARVALKDILRPDSGKSVLSMLSRHGRTTPCTDDFCNVRYMCTAAGSNGRAGVWRVSPRWAALGSLPFL